MKRLILTTLGCLGVVYMATDLAYSQLGSAIRVTADRRVYFDWPAVEQCARMGDRECLIAIAARRCQ